MRLRQYAQVATIHHVRRHGARRGRIETPARIVAEEALDDGVVLVRLERAGAVDEQPAGLYLRRGRPDELSLERRRNGEIRRLESPARIRMPAERSRAGARRVEQNGVHLPRWQV